MNMEKAVLDEITRRVFALEGKQRHFERHSEELNDHIEALTEVSRLPRHQIEAIAYALTHDDSLRPRSLRFWQSLALTLAIVGGILFFVNRPITPAVPVPAPAVEPPLPQAAAPAASVQSQQTEALLNPADQTLQKLYIQRAALANVFSLLSVLKTYLVNYYAENGKHPDSFKQLGIPDEDMNDGEYIKQVKILPKGALRVELSEFFGAGAYLTLTQQTIMGGTQIKWLCSSNLPQAVLTIGYGGSHLCVPENSEKVRKSLILGGAVFS